MASEAVKTPEIAQPVETILRGRFARFFCEMKLVQYLFNNMGVRQTILKNAFWLAIAQGATGLANFILAVVVIREFGAAEYGRFVYGFSLVFMFSTLFDFGLATAVMREFAKDKKKEEAFPALWTLKALLGLPVFAMISVLSFMVTSEVAVRHTIVVLSIYVFTLELLNFCFAFIRARQKMEIEAGLRLVNVIALVASVLIAVWLGCASVGLAWAYLIANICTLVVTAGFMATGMVGAVSFRFTVDRAVWREFIVVGWFLALSREAGDIMMYTDSVLLGLWNLTVQNGWYNAAMRVTKITLFPMALIASAVFPALLASMSDNSGRFRRLWLMWNESGIFLAGLLGFVIYFNSEAIIGLLFPADFAPAAQALKILTLTASVGFLHVPFYHAMLAFDRQKQLFFVMVAAALINVALNLILIPYFGLYGAAFATLVSHLTILLQYLWCLRGDSRVKLLSAEYVSIVITVIACGLILGLVTKVVYALQGYAAAKIALSILLFSFCFWLLHRFCKVLISYVLKNGILSVGREKGMSCE